MYDVMEVRFELKHLLSPVGEENMPQCWVLKRVGWDEMMK